MDDFALKGVSTIGGTVDEKNIGISFSRAIYRGMLFLSILFFFVIIIDILHWCVHALHLDIP